MSASPTYAIIDLATGALDRRIFSDQAVYEDEMAKIFRAGLADDRAREPGPSAPRLLSYLHGRRPGDPDPRRWGPAALLNMCRHRGNRVVRCDDGSARSFMCTYHGWTYASVGVLTHVPGESEAYYGALDKASLGLLEARSTDTYAGIVFATRGAARGRARDADEGVAHSAGCGGGRGERSPSPRRARSRGPPA